ncbi:UNVERIFIED_CONTAM: hypothetical protein Scaly_2278500 [Sesamum calycinum]|uniref:Wall-associated receptor kinase galacturonan-binding domain-containing protein n=1 Tax=Sesamum calycinum TaxID=2727403 RepID=A0AAW2MAC7_9LAMI
MASPLFHNPNYHSFLILLPLLTLHLLTSTQAKTSQCRTSCGQIPINYPFGIDDGCGSPYYRHILVCSDSGQLELRTPSGRYPVRNVSYTDPHILVYDPFLWNCQDGNNFRPARPFSLDTSTHFRLSPQNDYLFFNCSADDVIMESKPMFCERSPSSATQRVTRRATSAGSCPSAHPRCMGAHVARTTPRERVVADDAQALCHLHQCLLEESWHNASIQPSSRVRDQGGLRHSSDNTMPVVSGRHEGRRTCGFDTQTQDFLCLCEKGNATTYCKDQNSQHNRAVVVAGSVTAVSVAGAFVGGAVWYLKRLRAKAPVTHGVQTNDNRLF